MDWVEIIQLRSFTGRDRDTAIAAFGKMPAPVREEGLEKVALCQSLILENELSIFLSWQSAPPRRGRSRLGLQLAAAFAEFGHIYHSGWQQIAG